MHSRCPSSDYVGVGLLRGWNWLINERGYANIVPTTLAHSTATPLREDASLPYAESGGSIFAVADENPVTTAVDDYGTTDPNNEQLVYGLIYVLTPRDEKLLEDHEGVPWAYTKHEVPVTLWDADKVTDGNGRSVRAIVYIDTLRTKPGTISAEYVSRMRRGVQEAGAQGVPRKWMKETFGKWFDTEID